MSYVVHIWQTPIPTSVLQADKICDRLQEKEGRQNPKFIELAKRLTQRYPCRSQMTGDENDEEGVWLDEPLDGISPNPVIALGIRSDYVIEVMPFVTETANALGLTVYDTQLGECYLPSGQVLTMPGQAPADFNDQESSELIRSDAQMIEIAVEQSEEYYKKYGFKYSRKYKQYIKKYDDFYFSIQLYGGHSISLHYAICITKGLHLCPNTKFINNVKPEPAFVFSLVYFRSNHSKIWPHLIAPFDPDKIAIRVHTVPDVKVAMDKILAYDEQTIMPLLNQIRSLKDVDQFIRKTALVPSLGFIDYHLSNCVAQLVVSYFAKADDIEILIADVRNSYFADMSGISYREQFDQTVELIKLELNP